MLVFLVLVKPKKRFNHLGRGTKSCPAELWLQMQSKLHLRSWISVSLSWIKGDRVHILKLGLRQKNPAGEGRHKGPSLPSHLPHGVWNRVSFQCFRTTAHTPGLGGDPRDSNRKPGVTTPRRAPRQCCSCILAGTCRKCCPPVYQVQADLAFSTGTLQDW